MMLRKDGKICEAAGGIRSTETPTPAMSFSRTRSQLPHGIIAVLLLCAVFLFCSGVDAEINEEYGVFKIQQKAACPTVFCPWNCDRYIDNSGCLFCGKCLPQPQCPQVTCPSLPYFQCVPRQGRDGCTVCKCRVRSRQPYGGAPAGFTTTTTAATTTTTTHSELAALVSAPVRPLAPQAMVVQQPQPSPAAPVEPLPPSIAATEKQRPTQCMSMPMCSQNCRIENDVNGCPKCKCFPRRDCPESANAPCRRPDCQRLLGADGCYHCQCPDDVVVCREVKCFKPCTPLIDWNSGCATGCRCPNDAKNRK